MKDKKSQQFCKYFNYQLFASDAFQTMRASSKNVLTLILFEIKSTSGIQKQKDKHAGDMTNRNDIRLPYDDIMAVTGLKKKAVWSAFKEIFAHGFLEVVHHGGGSKGDVNIYGIREDWRKWEEGQVIRKMRLNGKAGWQKTKKISSPTEHLYRSPTGHPEQLKSKGRFPVGHPEITKKCASSGLG